MRKATSLFLLLALIACGGGGGGGSGSQISGTWTGSINSAGYPDVTGTYSFNMAAGSAVCSDGSSGSFAALAMNFRMTQSNNQVTLYNTSSAGIPAGTTVLSSDNLDGNVDLDGDFIIDQHVVLKTTSIPGTNSITYTLTGAFNPNGWGGTYQMYIYNDSIKGSCTYSAAFTGDKITQASSLESEGKNTVELKPIHDFEGMTSLIGQ